MKLLYLSNSVVPSRTANSIHVMKMCEAFAAHGHEVTLLVQSRNNSDGEEGCPFDFYGVQPCFRLKRVPWLNTRGRAAIYGAISALLVRLGGADLAYGRDLMSCYFATLLGVPVIYESHSPPDAFVASRTRRIHQRLLRTPRLRRLVVISGALRQEYHQRYGVRLERITVAHDAADYDSPGARGLELPKADLQVGYVGHLYEGRGIEMIAALARRCGWAHFHVVGGRDAAVERWRNTVADLPNITFYGFLSYPEASRFRAGCDVLVAPYQRSVATCGGGDTGRWMSPLKVFEYMAAGKPILCSDLPVLREVLRDEENALLCAPDHPEEWVRALSRLHTDLGLRTRLGARARQDFTAKYTWHARAEAVLDGIEA